MDAPFPMHPSYEARPGVPDRAFPWVSPTQGGRMTAAWARLIAGSEPMQRSRLLHLHHLTPLHDAAARVLPRVPVLTHLHGTELKMLDAIARDAPDVGQGPHARWWASRAKAAALRATATITTSPYERDEAVRLLGLDPATVHCLPNGVDTERFAPHRPSDDKRRDAVARVARARPAGMGRGVRSRRQRALLRGARSSTRSSIARPASAARCCCSSGASSASSGCRCWCARTPARARAWSTPRRSSSGAVCPVSGRRSTRTRSRCARASTASSSAAGAATTSCRPASAAPTASSRRQPTSRSGWSTSRRWPASCRSSPRSAVVRPAS